LFGTFSFKGGVHPPHNKSQTEQLPITILPPPPKVIIPLSQHIGAPAKLVVKRGDEVKVGQLLGEAGGFVSAPVYASVSGKVTSVGVAPHPLGHRVISVEIENDGQDTMVEFKPLDRPWRDLAPGELVNAVSAAGIVGMGGASFPTHVKLSPPSEKKIDTLIINGAECEPYLTADHRLMLEKAEELLDGTLILRKILSAEQVFIGIETNKPDAIAHISELISSSDQYSAITIAKLKPKYPQGGEKQLINAITKRQVPSGGLPMDVGCVVQNVGTACAVYEAITKGIPLYQRVVTVTGSAVKKPSNLLVRIGTPVEYVLKACEVDMSQAAKVIMGGPMMGLSQPDLTAPVIKSTSGLLVHDSLVPGVAQTDCISCGNCVKACPIHLTPSFIAKYIEHGKYEEADEWGVLDCVECGSCAYVCPAKINLVHFMKLGKFHVQAQRRATKKS